jgi:hypothetical protein
MRALLLLGAGLLSLGPGPRQAGESADRLLSALEKIHREKPDPSDPRAAASRLDFDRARILDFVRKLAWEPYPGILRDATGTLLCGGGNSIDRALLLQAMLEAGGTKTQLMRVEVPAEKAARLMESFRRSDARGRLDRPPADPKVLDRMLGLEGSSIASLVAERRRETADLVEELLEAGRAESARLEALLGARKAQPLQGPREHVWVQAWDTAKGDWVDLDPSPVEIPHDGAQPLEPETLAAQRRTLGFRLVLHRKLAGKAEAVPLLSVASDLASASWKQIELTVLSENRIDSKDLRKLEDRARVEVLRSIKQYRATLRIGGRVYGGAPFDLSGNVHEVDADGRIAAAKGLSRGIGGAFGGALGGGKEEAPKADFERLELEVSVKGPGDAQEVHRRTLAGPPRPGDSLRSLPLLHYSFLVDGSPLPPGEYARRGVAALAQQAEPFRRFCRGEEGARFKPRSDVSPLLLRFADVRRRVLARLAEGAVPLQAKPGLVAETRQIWVDEAAGRARYLHGIDLLDNPVAFVAPDGATASGPARVSGVADTLLEFLLVSRHRPGDARRSAWTMLDRARVSGARFEARERAGRVRLGASEEAWWEVDPATGGCVGRAAGGGGQAIIEYLHWAEQNLCGLADLAEAFSSQDAVGSENARTAAKVYDFICDALQGKTVPDQMRDQIIDRTKGLWNASADALGGW